jgi:hypothetical protein
MALRTQSALTQNAVSSLNLTNLPVEILVEIFRYLYLEVKPVQKLRPETWIANRPSAAVPIPIEAILENSVFYLLGTSKHLFHIAEEVFYGSNVILLRRTQLPNQHCQD